LRAPNGKAVVPPVVRELMKLLGAEQLERGSNGFNQSDKGLTLHYRMSQRGSAQAIGVLVEKLTSWGRDRGFESKKTDDRWQLTSSQAGQRYELLAKHRELSGSREYTDSLNLDVAITLTKLRHTQLAILEQLPALSGGARLPAYLSTALARYSLRSFGCTGYPGPCNYWSFELSEKVEPRGAMKELIALGKEHGFAFEDSTEDPTADWVESFLKCAHAHLNYKIIDGRLNLTLQASSLDYGDVTSVVRCTANKTPQVATQDPPGSVRIRDVLVLDWHKGHIDKVVQCYRQHRKREGAETTDKPWNKLGNTLRLSVIDTDRQYQQTPDQLKSGSWQASFDIFHYPHTGKPAERFDVRFWTKTKDGAAVIATFDQNDRSKMPADIGLGFHLKDQWIGLSVPSVGPPTPLKDQQAFSAAVSLTIKTTHQREIKDVDNLTLCDPSQRPGCTRIPATTQEKQQERRRLAKVNKQRQQLLVKDGERFRRLANSLYPFDDAACSLGLPPK